MMRIRNTWHRPLRGPDNELVPSGEVFEASRDWVRSRDDRFRRGQFELVENEPEEPPVEETDPETCAGTTKSGKPCKAKPMSGSAYCHNHEPE